jgi:hypothetical protein
MPDDLSAVDEYHARMAFEVLRMAFEVLLM